MTMRVSLRALAALLSYPRADMIGALPEIRAALMRDPVIAPALSGLDALILQLAEGDLLDLQEGYVSLFDRSRGQCLNLFEHVHGDSRERGPAMVELNDIYASAGLEPQAGELPDYLPAMLEFAAVDPVRGAELLGNAGPVLDLLHGRLKARDSAYAAVLHAVVLAAGAKLGDVPLTDAPDPTPEELDAAYEDQPVVFGPGTDPATECGVDALAAKLRAAHRNPNPMPHRRPVIRRVPSQSSGA